MTETLTPVAPAMNWQYDCMVMEGERAWREAYMTEAMWRTSSLHRLNLLRQLRQVDPQLAEAIWEGVSTALYDACAIAQGMVEAFLLGTPVPNGATENTPAHEGEDCLATLIQRARLLSPGDERMYDRVTDLALAAHTEKTVDRLVDIHLAALKAARRPG
ncbi:MAG TPA: hypothetical protein VKX16_12365 [Chloroflexota bacterium]|nr:hypothetical protein [Chloroflexota bacterium]